jgi:hypothetical protein
LQKIEKEVDPITLMRMILEMEGRSYMRIEDSINLSDGSVFPGEKFIVHPSLLGEEVREEAIPQKRQSEARTETPESDEDDYTPPEQEQDYVAPVCHNHDEEHLPELLVIHIIDEDIEAYTDSIKRHTFGPTFIHKNEHHALQIRMKEDQIAKVYYIIYSRKSRKSCLQDIIVFNAYYCAWKEKKS